MGEADRPDGVHGGPTGGARDCWGVGSPSPATPMPVSGGLDGLHRPPRGCVRSPRSPMKRPPGGWWVRSGGRRGVHPGSRAAGELWELPGDHQRQPGAPPKSSTRWWGVEEQSLDAPGGHQPPLRHPLQPQASDRSVYGAPPGVPGRPLGAYGAYRRFLTVPYASLRGARGGIQRGYPCWTNAIVQVEPVSIIVV